jgi:anti-sigma-K factor RskA
MSDTGAKDEDERGPPIAAEYALGVLGAHERRAVEQRIAREPAFAREVAFWEERLGGLAQDIGPVTPPADAWARIEAGLDRASNANSASGLWQSLAFWRGLALGASALAAACLAALVYLAEAPTLRPPLVAKLDESSGKSGFFAAANPADGSLTIVPAALLTGQEQHALELWVIPAGGKPHSLGLIDPGRPVKVIVPPELRPHVTADSVLAISVEPLGGSPTGQPTGPVIANGKLAAL